MTFASYAIITLALYTNTIFDWFAEFIEYRVYIDHSIILLLKPVMHNIQNLFIFTMPHIYIKETNKSLMFVTDYRSMYARQCST